MKVLIIINNSTVLIYLFNFQFSKFIFVCRSEAQVNILKGKTVYFKPSSPPLSTIGYPPPPTIPRQTGKPHHPPYAHLKTSNYSR